LDFSLYENISPKNDEETELFVPVIHCFAGRFFVDVSDEKFVWIFLRRIYLLETPAVFETHGSLSSGYEIIGNSRTFQSIDNSATECCEKMDMGIYGF